MSRYYANFNAVVYIRKSLTASTHFFPSCLRDILEFTFSDKATSLLPTKQPLQLTLLWGRLNTTRFPSTYSVGSNQYSGPYYTTIFEY